MKPNIQDLIEKGKEHRIFFVNGYRGKYTLLDFDDDTLIVKDAKTGHQQLIFIHAVSTIDLG